MSAVCGAGIEIRLIGDAEHERFHTLLFALLRLREVEWSGARSALVDFHASYKYTLLAYDEAGMRELGWIVASVAERPWAETLAQYRERFTHAFRRPATVGGHINALTHAFGHVSDRLSAAERSFFLRQLDELRAGRLPLSGALTPLRAWVIRYDVPYLAAQACFRPYPAGLR